MMVEYFSTSGGDFLPIHLKIAGLFALLHIAKISYYSIPALTPLEVVQHKASLNHKTTLNQNSQFKKSQAYSNNINHLDKNSHTYSKNNSCIALS